VTEVFPPVPPNARYINTTAPFFEVELDEGEDYVGPDFGNVCLGPGGGRTLGYWSNKNGYNTMTNTIGMTTALNALSALNLVDAGGNAFNPTSYTQFRTWLLNAKATNMAYMLSAQLAAMKLNVMAGFVNGGAFVYAPGVPGANPAGFISVNGLMTAANNELGAHPYTPAGSPYRALQEVIKNALDDANNNLNFVCPGPCLPIVYP